MNTMNRCINAPKGFSYWRVVLRTTVQVLIHSSTLTALAHANRAGTVPFNR